MSEVHRSSSMAIGSVALNVIKLRRLSLIQDPNELLFKLLSPDEGFLERLKQGSMGSEMTNLLLKVIAFVCNATHKNSLIQFLREVLSGTFLKQDVSELLKEYASDNAKSTQSDLKDIMRIVRALNQSFPSKSLSTVSALCSLMKYIIKETDIVKFSELEPEYERIEEELVCTRQQIQSGTVLKDQEKDDQWTVPESSNFRRLTVLPTDAEIQGQTTPYLRENKIYKEYKDATDYLDVQFRLLKEDFLRPLREGLGEIKENQLRGNFRKTKTNMKLYTNVKISPSHCSQEGIVYKIQFDINRFKGVKWEVSKRLLPGSLVCLSSDDFTCILVGVIAERKVEDLCRGVTHIYIDHITNDMEILRFKKSYKMVESPAYFEPYKNVLNVLQQTEDNALPFQEYLRNQDQTEIPPPKYLQRNVFREYNFSSLVSPNVISGLRTSNGTADLEQAKRVFVPVLRLEEWPNANAMGLDESQYRALRTAVTKEFAVIQGPPGTGKTYLGLKIIQLLLQNRQWDGPILIVCYTNHALDQFLEEIVKLRPEGARNGRFVRVGQKIPKEKSELLHRCSLQTLKLNHSHINAQYYYCIKRQMRCLEIRIMELMACIEVSETEILRYQVLSEFMDRVYFSDSRTYLEWLSGDNETPDADQQRPLEGENIFRWFEYYWYEDYDDDDDYSDGEDYRCKKRRYKIPEYHYDDLKQSVLTRGDSTFVHFRSKAYAEQLVASLYSAKKSRTHSDMKMSNVEITNVHDIWQLTLEDRWRLYNCWESCFIQTMRKKILELLRRFSNLKNILDEMSNERDWRILRNAEVVAMTTTGAAKRNELLKQVGPRVVIVEEAAEVLEAHVVTSLSKSCEHLILIGDHQQLRPKPADYTLSKHYRLDISLFEKIVLNKMHCECLSIQHRMRPEISELLVPHIYKSLTNHESVSRYRNVAGILGNLFFVTHSELESEEDDDKSHSNLHEAKFIASLCRYLLNVGYSASEITLLTTYTGQHFLLKSLLQVNGLRITPVDNYQGEENDIILLSLVRSNLNSSIGFLEIANRVCVALSRARQGLYIVGNGELLRDRSPLWRDIFETLKKKNRYVDSLPLGCRRHPDQRFFVKLSEDFRNVPLNGCIFPCEFRLNCGHVCDKICHELDEAHLQYKCRKACERSPIGCPYGHPCPKLCFESCIYCTFKVRRTLNCCGHEVEMMCHMKDEDFECNEPCKKSCPDGHPCQKLCFEICGDCMFNVNRKLVQCGHEVDMMCHMKVEEFKCGRACERKPMNCPDGHPCQKKCFEDCGDCTFNVRRTLTLCGHDAEMMCWSKVDEFKCNEPCKKSCPDGHLCKKRCYETCVCDELVVKILSRCQHDAKMPCHKNERDHSCSELVTRILEKCHHTATMKCHVNEKTYLCKEPCNGLCPSGHPCRRKCSESCKCEEMVKATMHAYCTHESMVPCTLKDKYCCFEQCERICSEGHRCNKQCYQPCGSCKVIVKKKLLLCDHVVEMPCGDSLLDYKCREKCKRSCKMGHPCEKPCFEICGRCEIKIEKPCPKCNETNMIECADSLKELECNQVCKEMLPCGHMCQELCGASPCTEHCRVLVEKALPCGHSIEVKCYLKSCKVIAKCGELIELKGDICEYGHQKVVECSRKEEQSTECQKPVSLPCSTNNPQHKMTVLCYLQKTKDIVGCNNRCDALLECGHRCKQECNQCAQSGKHGSCKEPCERQRSLCRHPCSKPCGSPCGDCVVLERKIFICQHTSYHSVCHESFVPCREPCTWKCPHFGCRKMCSEPCDRLPCEHPCNKKLTCTHPCVGLCGEPCPQKCWVCDNEELVSICQQLEMHSLEDERFLILSPCDHIVTVSAMDSRVQLNAKYPPYKVDRHLCLECPICGGKVSSCPRYNGILKRYEKHLNEAKTRISASDNMASQLPDIVTAWLEINNYSLNCVEEPNQLKSLKEATIGVLSEVEKVLISLELPTAGIFFRRLRPIQDNIVGVRNSWAMSESAILSDISKLYITFLEIQVRRMRKFLIGPSLRILDKSTKLLDSCSDLETFNETNLDRIWTVVDKVNHLLCTKLETFERKDKIDDYVGHLTKYYDSVFNANSESNWFCCSKGHVYSSEGAIDNGEIDKHCLKCSCSKPTGISKFFVAIAYEIRKAFRDQNCSIYLEDTNNNLDKEINTSNDLLSLDLAHEHVDSIRRSPERCRMYFNDANDGTKDKIPMNLPNENPRNTSVVNEPVYSRHRSVQSYKEPPIQQDELRLPVHQRSFQKSFSNSNEKGGSKSFSTSQERPDNSSWRRSGLMVSNSESIYTTSGQKERPELQGNWRNRSVSGSDALSDVTTGSTSFDGMRRKYDVSEKRKQNWRQSSDDQEQVSNWRLHSEKEPEAWRKPRFKSEGQEEVSNWRLRQEKEPDDWRKSRHKSEGQDNRQEQK